MNAGRTLGSRLARAALLGALLASGGAWAQQKLTVAAYGGSYEDMMRKEIIPAFEKKTGAKVEYVAGNSTDNIARMQAQRANQEVDVLIVDDGPMYQAVALGLCTDLKGVDVHARLEIAGERKRPDVPVRILVDDVLLRLERCADRRDAAEGPEAQFGSRLESGDD